MSDLRQENALLLREAEKIVQALGVMFAPGCEVVLHDLTQPDRAIVAIANNLSNRRIGDAATEMGLERIASPEFPDVVQNYASVFPDGARPRAPRSACAIARAALWRQYASIWMCLSSTASPLSCSS